MYWITGLFFIAFVLAVRHEFKLRDKKNAYILKHREYLENEKHYEDYLTWCEMNLQIPMDKKIYISEIEIRNNRINDIIK